MSAAPIVPVGDVRSVVRRAGAWAARLRETRDRYDLARALLAGEVAIRRGQAAQARAWLAEAVRLWRDMGLSAGLARTLAACAALDACQC